MGAGQGCLDDSNVITKRSYYCHSEVSHGATEPLIAECQPVSSYPGRSRYHFRFPYSTFPNHLVFGPMSRVTCNCVLKLTRTTIGPDLACIFCHLTSGNWHLNVY